MVFTVVSPPASRQSSRAATPADELLRLRLQASNCYDGLGADLSPRASSGAATPGFKASAGRQKPVKKGLSSFKLRPDLLDQLEDEVGDPARGVCTDAPFSCIGVQALQDLSRRPRGTPYRLGRAPPSQANIDSIDASPGRKASGTLRPRSWRPRGAPEEVFEEPSPQKYDAPGRVVKPPEPREDEDPFVPCCSPECPHEATLWSPLEKRPYCVRCWNGGLHHTDIGAKLAIRREAKEHYEVAEEEEEAPPSPQPRLYKGRCFLSDGSFAFRGGPGRLQQRGKGLDVTVSQLALPRQKRHTTIREVSDASVPLKVVNSKGNLENSVVEHRESMVAASGYSKLIQIPVFDEVGGQRIRRRPSKCIETMGGQAVVVNPRPPQFRGAPDFPSGALMVSGS